MKMSIRDAIIWPFEALIRRWRMSPSPAAMSEPIRDMEQTIAATRSNLDLVRIATYARMHGISRATVHNWIDKGLLDAFVVDGVTLVRRHDIVTTGIE